MCVAGYLQFDFKYNLLTTVYLSTDVFSVRNTVGHSLPLTGAVCSSSD